MNQEQLRVQARELLKQFGQIILHGPPGTGKTRLAFRVAAEVLGVRVDDNQNNAAEKLHNHPQFAIVQFHPAYNYEDFVRGIQVSAVGGQVVYSTDDRVFGKIAKDASGKPKVPHVIVIDEINRANVSAVLGELIYGLELEYRDKQIQTPYQIDGDAGLIIPRNLSVIGTMNTADRTIGQIDYAVRRRFAFVRCLPDESVVKEIGGPRAPEFFRMTDDVFNHISADHDKEDVRIGHSYFLADGNKLANKIIYQVVPILREYVKDGVLKREAGGKILEIKNKASAMLESPARATLESPQGNRLEWRWIHPQVGSCGWRSLRQMVLSLVRSYALNHGNPRTLSELREAFPDECAWCSGVVLNFDDVKDKGKKGGFFTATNERIQLPDGTVAVVCGEWGATGDAQSCFEKFKERAEHFGYTISRQPKGAPQPNQWGWKHESGEEYHADHPAAQHIKQCGKKPLSVRGMVSALVWDYIRKNNITHWADLRDAFPENIASWKMQDRDWPFVNKGSEVPGNLKFRRGMRGNKTPYLELGKLGDGTVVYVFYNDWGEDGDHGRRFEEFRNHVRKFGYEFSN